MILQKYKPVLSNWISRLEIDLMVPVVVIITGNVNKGLDIFTVRGIHPMLDMQGRHGILHSPHVDILGSQMLVPIIPISILDKHIGGTLVLLLLPSHLVMKMRDGVGVQAQRVNTDHLISTGIVPNLWNHGVLLLLLLGVGSAEGELVQNDVPLSLIINICLIFDLMVKDQKKFY